MIRPVMIRLLRSSALIGLPVGYWFGWQIGILTAIGAWNVVLMLLAPKFFELETENNRLLKESNARLAKHSEFQNWLVNELVEKGILTELDEQDSQAVSAASTNKGELH